MELPTKPKKNKTIIFVVIVAAAVIAAVLIYLFQNGIITMPTNQEPDNTEAPTYYQPEQPAWGEPWPETEAQTTPPVPQAAIPPAANLPGQGPFSFPMPQTPQAGYFFVIDYYYPSRPGTGYRIISYERPGDLDFSAIEGNWYLESSRIRLAESNIRFRGLQENQGAKCVIDDRLDSQSPPPAATAPPQVVPTDAQVKALFKATRTSKMAQGNQLNANEWLVYLPAGTTITIPAGWIANTDPQRWTMIGAPAGYSGNYGEELAAGTKLTALTNDDELYIRYSG